VLRQFLRDDADILRHEDPDADRATEELTPLGKPAWSNFGENTRVNYRSPETIAPLSSCYPSIEFEIANSTCRLACV
jgi:hypothetical protein